MFTIPIKILEFKIKIKIEIETSGKIKTYEPVVVPPKSVRVGHYLTIKTRGGGFKMCV